MSNLSAPLPDFIEKLQGDPWIELEWRRGLSAKVRDDGFRRDSGDVSSSGGRYAYRLRSEQRVKNARKVPQAVVKIIPGGGCSGRGQLIAQLNYLSRDGELELEEGYMDFRNPILDTDDIRDTATRWAMDWEDAMSRDGRTARTKNKTFHMLISYPEGTDLETAKEAADAFANRLCHSGEFGDELRNVRAWHTDRAHPHMHLVIDRLGESGRMMQIHPAKDINPKCLRALQVDTAAEYGLALNDTPRVSRGHRELGLSSAEHRLEQRGQRMDRSELRQRYAMVVEGYAEISIDQEITELRKLASEYEQSNRVSLWGQAHALNEAADTLASGGTLKPEQHQERERRLREDRERSIARDAELCGMDRDEPSPSIERPETSIWDRLSDIGHELAPNRVHNIDAPVREDFEFGNADEPVEQDWAVSPSSPWTSPKPDEPSEQETDERRDEQNLEAHRDEKPDWKIQMEEYRKARAYWDNRSKGIYPTPAGRTEEREPETLERPKRETEEELHERLDANERKMIEEERSKVRSLLDDLEAKKARDPNYKPSHEEFMAMIEEQEIKLIREEKERAREMGINLDQDRDDGYGLGF